MGVDSQGQAPATLHQRRKYALYRRLGGSQGRSGRVQKSTPHRDSIPGPTSQGY